MLSEDEVTEDEVTEDLGTEDLGIEDIGILLRRCVHPCRRGWRACGTL
jgi:hypothetical protein